MTRVLACVGHRRTGSAFIGLVGWVAITATTAAAPGTEAWDIKNGDVRVTCPLTVGGSFEAKTSAIAGALSFDPSASVLSGELSVELKTLDTGISLRTEHMRDDYLEVGKGESFERAVLSNIDIGSGGLSGGQRSFAARLRLHGTTQAVAGKAAFTRHGTSLRVDASFPLRMADYGINDPRYLGVGVKNEVTVRVTFTAISAS